MKRLFIFLGIMVLGVTPAIADGATNGATALLVGGKGGYAELTDEQMITAFGGYFADYDARVSIPFPGTDFETAIQVGTENLYAAVYATPGPKTIGGVSQGAPAIPLVLLRLMADMNDPASEHHPGIPPDELNVAVYGFPDRKFFIGIPYPTFPETPYDVVIVFAEYDGIADYPDRPFSLLAKLNAVRGADLLHVDSAFYDIRNFPTNYIIVTNSLGGTTTIIMIPTPVLPLLMPMLDAGADPERVARLDKLLRPIIDLAYRRPDWQVGIPDTLTGPPTSSAPAEALSAPQETIAARAPEPAGQLSSPSRTSIAPQPAGAETAPAIYDVIDSPTQPTPAVIRDDHEGVKESDGDDNVERFGPATGDDAITHNDAEVDEQSGPEDTSASEPNAEDTTNVTEASDSATGDAGEE